MAIGGPFLVGALYQRNRTSWTLSPSQNIPAGALIFLVCGGTIDDTATLTITDSANNTYVQQVFSQQPGTVGSLMVFLAPNIAGLTTAQSITVASSQRGDLLTQIYYYTGANGSLFSTDVEWNAGQSPSGTVNALAGMALFGLLAVAGPNNDGFAQAAGWGADLTGGIATVNATIHAGARSADVDGAFTYAPTLAAARQSVILVAALR